MGLEWFGPCVTQFEGTQRDPMSVAPEMDNLDTIKANGGTGIRFRDPQVIGAGERGNAYDVSGSPSPSKDHHPRGALHRKLLERKVTWILATALTVLLCVAIAQPAACHHVDRCRQEHARIQDLRSYSGYITAALASVMLHELASVILTHRTARKAIHLIPNIRESLLPSVLLCITFFVLILENLALVIGETPWFAHAANLGHPELDGQPVYTVFYAEWLINVPILLILAGSIALQRPTPEVAEPLVVTNVYIVFAWVAHFVSNPGIRYFLVALSFLMYFRASWSMCRWVWNWHLENSDDHHILGRPLLTFVLILVFGIYGAVYVSRLHGGVSYRDDRIFFTTMNFTTKLFASMTLAGIRSSEFQEVLLSMLANTQTSFKRSLKYEDTTPMLED